MSDMSKKEAFEEAKKFFDKFDVDNDSHSAVIVMYDQSEGHFRMLTVNASTGQVIAMLDKAMETLVESVIPPPTDRTIN